MIQEILEILETAGGWEPGQRASIAEFRRAARAFESWGAHAGSGAEAAITAFAEIDVAGSGMVPIEDIISWAVERRDRVRGGGDFVPPPPALFTPDTEALTPLYTSEETDPIHGLGFSPIGASRPSRSLPTRRSGSCCSSLRSGTTLSPSASALLVPAHRSLLHPTAISSRQRGPSAELGYWNPPLASEDDASPSQQPSQQPEQQASGQTNGPEEVAEVAVPLEMIISEMMLLGLQEEQQEALELSEAAREEERLLNLLAGGHL